MQVFKGFCRGTTCRGKQFVPGLNIEPEANAAKNGLHAASDPLDVFAYYRPSDDNEYWLCDAGGDIDEDATDTKVSCTELMLIRPLTLEEMAVYAIRYRTLHIEQRPEGQYSGDGICVAWGKRPVGSGKKIGDVIGLLKTNKTQICCAIIVLDGEKYVPDREYTVTIGGIRCAR